MLHNVAPSRPAARLPAARTPTISGPALISRPPVTWEGIAPLQPRDAYLIAIDSREDADTLCCQLLAARSPDEKAILFSVNREPVTVVAGLRDDEGPGELSLYRLDAPAGSPFKALATLPRTLARKLRPECGLLILSVAASAWDDCSNASLEQWLDSLSSVLRGTRCALLILAHGNQAANFAARARTMNDSLAGLVQLRRQQDYAYYQIRHWRSCQGVTTARQLLLAKGPDLRFTIVLQSEPQRPMESVDSDVCLAEVNALGNPPLSPPFTATFENAQKLYSRALLASAATVIFSLNDSARIPELGGYLHRLRRERGSALKLVVREMAPCLRHRDEQALLSCGATLIVPHGIGNTRFLTLLESVQGQTYARPLAINAKTLVVRSQPPRYRGKFPAPAFARHIADIVGNPGLDGQRGVLLILQPVATLTTQQAMGQCQLRRHGDLACAYRDRLFLYLFDCSAETAPHALQQVFRLPCAQLFNDWQAYTSAEEIHERLRPLRSEVQAEPTDRDAAVASAATATVTPDAARRPSPLQYTLLN